jgi:hypothetical protein
MDFIKVKSSNLDSIAYDPETQELQVAFKPHKEGEPGRVYAYAAVPLDTYEAFLGAESVGSFFAIWIRANYECHRIDTPKEKPSEEEKQEASPKAKPKAKRIS